MLAKTSAETAQIDQFKSSIEAFGLHKQQEADRRFATNGLALGKDLDQKLTSQTMTSDATNYSQQLESFRERVGELRKRPGVSAHLKEAQLASLDAVLRRKRRSIRAGDDCDHHRPASLSKDRTVQNRCSTTEKLGERNPIEKPP